jgi:hypothetical protein
MPIGKPRDLEPLKTLARGFKACPEQVRLVDAPCLCPRLRGQQASAYGKCIVANYQVRLPIRPMQSAS